MLIATVTLVCLPIKEGLYKSTNFKIYSGTNFLSSKSNYFIEELTNNSINVKSREKYFIIGLLEGGPRGGAVG